MKKELLLTRTEVEVLVGIVEQKYLEQVSEYRTLIVDKEKCILYHHPNKPYQTRVDLWRMSKEYHKKYVLLFKRLLHETVYPLRRIQKTELMSSDTELLLRVLDERKSLNNDLLKESTECSDDLYLTTSNNTIQKIISKIENLYEKVEY